MNILSLDLKKREIIIYFELNFNMAY